MSARSAWDDRATKQCSNRVHTWQAQSGQAKAAGSRIAAAQGLLSSAYNLPATASCLGLPQIGREQVQSHVYSMHPKQRTVSRPEPTAAVPVEADLNYWRQQSASVTKVPMHSSMALTSQLMKVL